MALHYDLRKAAFLLGSLTNTEYAQISVIGKKEQIGRLF